MTIAEEKAALDRILRGKSTNHISDQLVHASLLSAYRSKPELFNYLRQQIMQRRRQWINWHQINQNKWQTSKSINRNHDSFELREKYVATHNTGEREYTARAREYNKKRQPKLYNAEGRGICLPRN